MGTFKGGAATQLITYYRKDEDGYKSFGKNRYIAQTFTLNLNHAIFRVVVKIRLLYDYWKPILCALYTTDAQGKPLGLIAQHLMKNTDALQYGGTKWITTDFKEFPQLGPGLFAIVISSPTQIDWERGRWMADITAPTYTDGKAWLSHDAGGSWEEHLNTDFMFEVWGYTPPPEPPPPPDLDNWAVTEFSKILLDDGFLIQCTTNRPCHLFLRYSFIEPQKHLDPVFRRGLPMHTDPRFCFVAWRENEQDEVGDTLTHSWYKHGWKDGETRWFYFVGSRASEQSPSVSPIFDLHFGPKTYECDGPELAHYPISTHYTLYLAFKAQSTYIPEHVRVTLGRKGEPGEVRIDVVRLASYGIPDTNIMDSDTKVITGMPEIPYFKHFTYQFPKARFAKGAWYCFKATCDSVPPIEARWKGWPIDLCPDTYAIIHRLYDNQWFTYPDMQFYTYTRGKLIV